MTLEGFVRYHDTHTDMSDPAACWLWTGYRDPDGYGRYGGLVAHRVVYELSNGPIGEGLTIDHLCRNRACVNPAHMEAVTQAENFRRSLPFRPPRRPSHCGHGHEFTPENTYVRANGGRECRPCSLRRTRVRDEQRREQHRG